jgi:hypothetical protein
VTAVGYCSPIRRRWLRRSEVTWREATLCDRV